MVYNLDKVKKVKWKGGRMKPFNPENGRVTADIPMDIKKLLMHKAVDENLTLSKYIAKILMEHARKEK